MRVIRLGLGAPVGAIALLVLVLTAAGSPPAGAIDTADLRTQQVVTVRCTFSHRAPDDPIALPGQSGASHLHDFFGATGTNAHSTHAQLVAGETTCDRGGDTAAYWMPSVLVDGLPVEPLVATVYYRSFAADPADVVAHPPDFRMIGGDPTATAPQGTKRVAWGCRAEGKKDTWVAEIPDCRGADTLVFRVDFPECWNGVDLDSADHRSHVAYQRASGDCPPTHPVSIPEVAMTVEYPPLPEDGAITLSTGGEFDGHADFWNTWDQTAYLRVVAGCLHSSRWCRNSAGPSGGAAPDVQPDQPVRDDEGVTCSAAPAGGWTALRHRSAVAQAATLSDDGTVVAYELQRAERGASHIVVVSRADLQVLRAGGDGRLFNPALSGDGRWLAVRSTADLVADDDNGLGDVYLHDLHSGTWSLVSFGRDGASADGPSFDPAVSRDGRFVVFDSRASNLVEGDGNGRADVFLLDRDPDGDGVFEPAGGLVERVSVGEDGREGDRGSWNGALSDDGQVVAFVSAASTLGSEPWNRKQHVFVRHRGEGVTVQVSTSQFEGVPASSASGSPEVSGDGSVVVFESSANNMVPADNGMMDVFAYDVAGGTLSMVSRELRRFPSGRSAAPDVSDDGRFVVYASEASALVTGDGNGSQDVFLSDRLRGTTTRVSVAGDGAELDRPAAFPRISGDGQVVLLESADAALGLRGDQGLVIGRTPQAC